MTLQSKAQELLAEWEQYRHVHYGSRKAPLDEVLDIEFSKNATNEFAILLREGLIDTSTPERELKFRVDTMEKHLRSFKDHVTIELLKHG